MAEPEAIVAGHRRGVSHGRRAGNDPRASRRPAGRSPARRVLVTSGPTREMLDPIRFLSNRSSGRMGAALAAGRARAGRAVILVHGPMAAPVPAGVEAVAGRQRARDAGRRPGALGPESIWPSSPPPWPITKAPQPAGQKLKGGETLTLELRRTPDIAGWAGANRRAGPGADRLRRRKRGPAGRVRERKLAAKRLDFICANDIRRRGSASKRAKTR